MSVNPVQHDRTKHITVNYHFVRYRVASGGFNVQYIPTSLQVVDMFMRGQSSKQFSFLKYNLSVRPPDQIERA